MGFKNKKAVIFDLDGTLADTIDAITEAINMTMDSFGYPRKSADDVRRAIGNGARMLIRRVLPAEYYDDEEVVSKVLARYDAAYALTYMHTDVMYDGVREALEALYASGKKLAVLSNKQDLYVKALSEIYFPNGTISVSRGQTELPVKPDPSGVYTVLEDLGVSADECVFVGDSGVDLATAENAHMDVIAVSWGFVGREGLEKIGAEVIIDRPEQLLDLIK